MSPEELAKEFLDEMLKDNHAPREHGHTVMRRGEFGILVYLTQHNNGANVGELTEFLDVTSGRTAAALKALEKKGFIRREADKADSRRICVYLTEAGRAQFLQEYERAVLSLVQLFNKLGEEDALLYTRLLKRINSCR